MNIFDASQTSAFAVRGVSGEVWMRSTNGKEELSKWIIAGAGGGSAVVVGGLVIVVRKRHAHLQAIMAMLFTEVEWELPVCRYPHAAIGWLHLHGLRGRLYRTSGT